MVVVKINIFFTFWVELYFHGEVISTLAEHCQSIVKSCISHVDPTHLKQQIHCLKHVDH